MKYYYDEMWYIDTLQGILKPWPRTITFTTSISQKWVFLIIKISSRQIFPFKDFDAKDHMTHHLFKG